MALEPGGEIGWGILGEPRADPCQESLRSAIEALRQAMFVMTEQAKTINQMSRPTFIHEREEKKEDPCQSK